MSNPFRFNGAISASSNGVISANDSPSDVLQAVAALLAAGQRGALATVLTASGSTPQCAGARLLLRADGACVGTIGGGRVEQVILAAMSELLTGGVPQVLRYHLTRDLGMCCGGTMEVFVEPLEPRPQLLLLGAGHVAQPTAHFAQAVGFAVTVVDDREELNTSARFPQAQRVLLEPTEALRRSTLPQGAATYAVICTHDHQLDMNTLLACTRRSYGYLGMIGSRRKVLRAFAYVQQRHPEVDLKRVHAPIGLDLGAQTPEEIALAIVSQLVGVRRGGSLGPMHAAGLADAPAGATHACPDKQA